MKSMLFKVTPDHVKYSDNPNFDTDELPRKNFPFLWYLKIPILPAFSVSYFSVEHKGDLVFSVTRDDIDSDIVIVETDTPTLHDFEQISVVVHYNGIRNYSLLFP
ncbi:hypothetical protein [Bacillus paramycoides]|uniref:hypothetical protein n=1 Tax=Bacillus paramycoides TaxID=2026194 RepID=UPI0037FA265A